jgi:hypothetical protein
MRSTSLGRPHFEPLTAGQKIEVFAVYLLGEQRPVCVLPIALSPREAQAMADTHNRLPSTEHRAVVVRRELSAELPSDSACKI